MLTRPLALVLIALSAAVPHQPSLLVSAATSLTDVLEEIGRDYTASGGAVVRFNFAASNVLARQLASGAPADVFVSADARQMDAAERAGVVAAGSRVDVIANQLVVAAPRERAAVVAARFAAAPPEIRRLAIGDPAAVPAGVYARQYLEALNLWRAYEPRIVPAANVRAALVALENGAADAAIVYATDMSIARTATVAITVPAEQGPRIVYPAAVMAASANRREAQRFVDYLTGPRAAAIFRRHRFLPVSRR
jgi:molybdate transport system substrate-binding protein